MDNTFFTLVLNPAAAPRPDPGTGNPVDHHRLRIEALIEDLGRKKAKIVLPTPAIAEAMCICGDFDKVLVKIEEYEVFEPCTFDTRSAIELARMTRVAVNGGDKRGGSLGDWQKIKIDRQIVAIAKVNGASILYTDDDSQTNFATHCGLKVVHTWDLDLPASHAQIDWVKEREEAP
jgi:predicted nucleic acid-binding protein